MPRSKKTARKKLFPEGTFSRGGSYRDDAPELPNGLIAYASQEDEPPRKRQKTSGATESNHPNGIGPQHGNRVPEESLDYLILDQPTWDFECVGSKLSDVETPLEKTNVKTFISWSLDNKPTRIGFVCGGDRDTYTFDFPEDTSDHEDALLALHIHRESSQWAKGQGKLWTEFGFILLQIEGIDHIRIVFTVKWSFTKSIRDIVNTKVKPPSLTRMMERYFPDSAAPASETWTPHDFYQSVYTPPKEDNIAAAIKIDLKSNLFPFQKRAVRWLLRREGVDWTGDRIGLRSSEDFERDSLPSTFMKGTGPSADTFFMSSLYGCITRDVQPFLPIGRELRGGILAEEMGLGKTLETISLITLHRRPSQRDPTVFDPYTFTHVQPIGATLIICPPTLVQQWISEVQRHSHLTVMHYEGISKSQRSMSPEVLRDSLITSDVVISTYAVLAGEINYTLLNPEKSLRKESKYKRPKSPLMEFSWWRICIDEAQMVESGVSNAATVARILPRVNAWCITGTPVRKDVNDLLGLLIFLRAEPYATIRHIWASLISTHKSEFYRLFGHLALRHNKKTVRNELKLPAQKRYVITMPFTPIEEQHYQELFNKMCEQAGVDADGSPLIPSWNPDEVADTMRQWLVRLRQTCVHPEVGGRNRRALGRNDGPLRTMDQVLDVMTEQTDNAIRTEQRVLLSTQLKRGQLFENSPRVKEALAIWDAAAREASVIVRECRDALQKEIAKIPVEEVKSATEGSESDDTDAGEKPEVVARLSVFRNRLRAALEVEHIAVFFRTNAYFQIKSNEEMTKPDSSEFQDLEKRELDGYEEAKGLRREILQEIFRKADRLMKKVSKLASTQSFVEIPEFKSDVKNAGLESRRIIAHLETLATSLDAQANTLDEWREHTIQLLLRPLVDEEEGIEVTGEEYEESTKNQDEIFCYVQALRALISDRHDTLTGQENKLIHFETKTALRLAKDEQGPFPEKTLELLELREKLRVPRETGSIRGIVAEFRALATSLRPDSGIGSARVLQELSIVENQLNKTQKQLTLQTKATAALEKELELFTNVMNTRLEYYRQLQQVSDSVAPYEGPINDQVLKTLLDTEAKLSQKVATAKSKRRYLEHLRQEASNPQEQRICIICRETFEVGAITVCGHQYCKECIGEWWHNHRTCPVCKQKINLTDLHEITYKPQELSIEAEEVQDGLQERALPSANSRKSAIYSEISKTQLAEIKNIELDGPSFTTKIDTLARHLIWLRETDPGAKSIIYSQFKDFLEVLARAFKRFRIGFSSIDKPNGIESFKSDPATECFLLHARAHSSGLNLVNASHVFLCEPLLNTALELQAIARVDRIGQQQETNVWLYLISGTVEESIHQLSVERRMEHIGHARSNGKGKAKETTPEEILDSNLEEANSLALQEAPLTRLMAKGERSGEMIEQEDLWACLFGGRAPQKSTNGDGNGNRARGGGHEAVDTHNIRNNLEIRRHLGAEAATRRLAQHTHDGE